MNIAAQFPVLENYTYLNTAATGVLSRSIQQWRRDNDEEFIQLGSEFRIQQNVFFEDLRQHVARFFQGSSENTFLVQNFSIAFNTFLDGLSRDHRFLLIKSDYPSVNYPVECRGFSCAYAALDENLEQNILAQIEAFKPSVLAISLVQYINGIKIDLDFLKRLKNEYPDMLIVGDGTQFCGTERFNFKESGLDVLISSAYKWMLGGFGNGFMLIKDNVYKYLYQDRLKYPLPKEPFLNDKKMLSLCFEPGHLDTLNFGSLKQAILLLEEVGFDFIEERLRSIGEIAKKAFTDRGLLSSAVIQRASHSTIFNIPADIELIKRIYDANILVSPRGEGLRISFHFYNNEQDLERLLKVIDRN
ncbi:MAG: aminotransferase class V-fold PLP-dependent enzyme [Candidatus Pedobacter colombiensis]|uniref:Aminotransferase class V-fold PLP-dependent enzyme n=1 Tax=Candidatus Pedobacter colombiensis TaxID=3121371 RepID=A0AAJ5WDB2_9SPHI|nr:aminotransferase class V-fold PLP-dependent enzyme [Pedobacter sp.]WEK21430.1 MAG: aminotransferase class V-fold PLP-dependent enzyme [Pedobacter sp.]